MTNLHDNIDQDGDGFVTQAEIAEESKKSLNGMALPQTDPDLPLPLISADTFDMADTNNDGRISLSEAVAVARHIFALQDTNHDGVVTAEERAAFRLKMAATRDARTDNMSAPAVTPRSPSRLKRTTDGSGNHP